MSAGRVSILEGGPRAAWVTFPCWSWTPLPAPGTRIGPTPLCSCDGRPGSFLIVGWLFGGGRSTLSRMSGCEVNLGQKRPLWGRILTKIHKGIGHFMQKGGQRWSCPRLRLGVGNRLWAAGAVKAGRRIVAVDHGLWSESSFRRDQLWSDGAGFTEIHSEE